MDEKLKYYYDVYCSENFSKEGLSNERRLQSIRKYGRNILTEKNKITLFSRIIKAIFEPMIIILIIAFFITLGVNLGNYFAGEDADFYECIGVFAAIAVSVGLTVVMESKSEKAFEELKKLGSNVSVVVKRNSKNCIVNHRELAVGDVVFFEAGDKITADGIIIDCNGIEVEESTLSGESRPIKKKKYQGGEFEEENMLFSGTFIKSGNASMIVLAVGDNAQIGKIAGGLVEQDKVSPPLAEKLANLSKKISVFGIIAAIFVFGLTVIRLHLAEQVNVKNIQQAFMQAMVLLVAAVPEGLPSTVAISLALSVVKLAKSNAIIKKLIAAETVGCVSVICSDKTGTLTHGKMQVSRYIINGKEVGAKALKSGWIFENAVYNSTASFVAANGKISVYGNSTEQALLSSLIGENYKLLNDLRSSVTLSRRLPFSSERKYMLTEVYKDGVKYTFLKGAIERVVELCNLTQIEKNRLIEASSRYEKNAERIIAFAHDDGNGFVFDGFCSICDNLRSEVFNCVSECKKAGIKIKILTGDNKETAIAIAKKLALYTGDNNVLTGAEVQGMSDERLKEIIGEVTLIARSTPETKLRVVRILKQMGEVVAVTGDGVNDAPAVKNADIGIAMGDGSEITKQASDIILLDNCFSVIVKAVAFGRNIYRNFQRFLFFQLTVNFSAVAVIVVFLILGFKAPFSTMQLLWINVIMDGPLALSLGLERREEHLMDERPVKRSDSIVTLKMFIRIAFHAVFIVTVIILQKLYNFLGASANQSTSVIFCLFVIFQLFNGINGREAGQRSIVHSIGKNKVFSLLLIVTLIMQIVITEFATGMFLTVPLGLRLWIKIFLTCFSLISVSEGYKFIYRYAKKRNFFKRIIKRSKFA
ncbi:MAG: calcium-translocating P-type ATPase, PMCA-type [Clostridia bacterium]|nr:calcium-translocating P-type ATPase, PMCA-type [Clostridia bacterium]